MKSDNKIFAATVLTGAVAMAVLTMVSPIPGAELSGEWYEGYATGLGLEQDFASRAGIAGDEMEFIPFISTADLTADKLTGGTPVVEIILGVCLDDNGNGEVINTESEYNYIRYSDDIQPGDIVLTYALYSGNGIDDVVWVEDYVIDTNQIIEEE